MPKTIKLTSLMITQLYDCKEKQRLNIHCKQSHFPQTLKGLLQRDLVTFEEGLENGKTLMFVILTQKAEDFLKTKDQVDAFHEA